MVPLSFAGHALFALSQTKASSPALYWPARRALLLADLHFEKASWFAHFGQMLPPYDSAATLDAIEGLAAVTDAREIWCLGDSFHDNSGALRLPDDARARIRELTARLRWTWITGNHDAQMRDRLGGEVMQEALVDGIVLRHEADPADPRPEISGHFHPKLRLSLRGRAISRRCFVRSRSKLLLPAFGALAGGLDAGHVEIRKVMGQTAEALLPVAGQLLCFPLAQ